MSTKWSYSGDPSSSQRDAVRFRVGDTDPNEPIFTDAELDHLVLAEGSTNEASIAAAKAAVAKYARQVATSDTEDKKTKRRDFQQRLEHFQALVKELVAQRSKRTVGIFAGGLSISQKQAVECDTDRVAPAFKRTTHDNDLINPAPGWEP